jgi:hypothetical protein
MKKYNHIKGIDLRKSIPLNLFTFDLVSFPGFVIADPYKSFNLCYAV